MDPYSAVFNEYLNPSFLDDDLPVPNFERIDFDDATNLFFKQEYIHAR
jgi:hypothetical protein